MDNKNLISFIEKNKQPVNRKDFVNLCVQIYQNEELNEYEKFYLSGFYNKNEFKICKYCKEHTLHINCDNCNIIFCSKCIKKQDGEIDYHNDIKHICNKCFLLEENKNK